MTTTTGRLPKVPGNAEPVRSVGGARAPAGIIGSVEMPEISRFFGIVIAIYYKEHGVPHSHAKYAGQTGVFSIVDLKLIEGRLPKRVVALVVRSRRNR